MLAGSPFVLLFLIGLLTVAAAITLWLELLIREAAVYVVVLMLPLFFAALVWPARRVWAVRAVELLVALIISKFAIVAVLSLGGCWASATATIVERRRRCSPDLTLVMLAAFAPWALVRLLPLHELASGGRRASIEARGSCSLAHRRPRPGRDRESPRRSSISSRPRAGMTHPGRVGPRMGHARAEKKTRCDDGTPSEEPVAVGGAGTPRTNGDASAEPSSRSGRVSHSAPGVRQNEMEPRWQADSWSWPTIERLLLAADHAGS